MLLKRFLSVVIAALWALAAAGWINVGGDPLWIERTSPDEHHWLLKNSYLSAGSAAYARKDFDHSMQESVNVVFVPSNEKGAYTTETRWYDPSGQEYRVIRKHYDITVESREGMERKKEGTPRVHTMPTRELVGHKAGTWKVEIYIDKELARRLQFFVK